MVSSVDLEVERVLRQFLTRQTSGTGFLGEESGAVDPDADMRWVLDPVDGTANLVRGVPLYALSLGLLRGDRAVAGVVSLPGMRRRYWATEG
jgi:myo-inositol-1(or 4)-monophosphatase